tara:strand:+ start:83 stop:655 length:573 start_codon:yes stop_codon:yes gene_type:complete
MKKLIFIISVIFMFSCKNLYEQEEIKVITDFTNSYLKKEHFEKLENYKLICSENEKLDSSNLKIYISDYLLPISKIRKDKKWLFDGNYSGNDSIIFRNILDSKKFNELSYREFNKSEIQLIENYNLIDNYSEEEDFVGIKFSRVCFDENKENAILLIEYNFNCDKLNVSGFERPYLLKKMNNSWKYIPTK